MEDEVPEIPSCPSKQVPRALAAAAEEENKSPLKQSITMEEDNTTIEEDKEKSQVFPVARINRIIRSEAPDFRITHESIFLINKATEQFLEQFCQESYSRVAREHRKAVEYSHISSVVSEIKRYDFLSDFVPEMVKAENALAERVANPTTDEE